VLGLYGALRPALAYAKPVTLPMLVNSFKSDGKQLAESLTCKVNKCWQMISPLVDRSENKNGQSLV
jgi:hypothetical protein